MAKLRMHTDHTLKLLEDLTAKLGSSLTMFVDQTCSQVETKELSREYQARKRRESRRKQQLALKKGMQKAKPGHSLKAVETTEPGATISCLTYSFTI